MAGLKRGHPFAAEVVAAVFWVVFAIADSVWASDYSGGRGIFFVVAAFLSYCFAIPHGKRAWRMLRDGV